MMKGKKIKKRRFKMKDSGLIKHNNENREVMFEIRE